MDDSESAALLMDYSAPPSPSTYDLMEGFGNIPAPSDDIWKKFELLPTPPRSPDRSDKCSENIYCDPAMGPEDMLHDISFEHDIIDELLRHDFIFEGLEDPEWPLPAKSELLHDCMWSGQCTEDCKQKRAREKHHPTEPLVPTSLDCVVKAACVTTPDDVCLPRGGSLDDAEVVEVAQCVDPSSVLSYTPLSDHCYHQANAAVSHHYPAPDTLPQPTLSAPSPAATGTTTSPKSSNTAQPILLLKSRQGVWKREYIVSDTPSESDEDEDEDDDDDDDEDDEDDEEDEEIDVVTVAGERHHHHHHHPHHHHQHHAPTPAPRTTPTSRSRGHTHAQVPAASPPPTPASRMTSSGRVVTPSQKLLSTSQSSRRRRHYHHHLHHGTAGKRRRSRHTANVVVAPAHPAKRSRREDPSYTTPSRRVTQTQSSDSDAQSEGTLEKRKEHNSMERKRRDDLRSAFQHLRLMVPKLKDNPKAPKVTILSDAAEHAIELTNQSHSMERMLKQEQHRHMMLQKKLMRLQRLKPKRH